MEVCHFTASVRYFVWMIVPATFVTSLPVFSATRKSPFLGKIPVVPVSQTPMTDSAFVILSRKNIMNRLSAIIIVAVLLTAHTVLARDLCFVTSCNPCEPVLFDPCQPVRGKVSLFDQFNFYGWLQAGITVNNHGQKNTYGEGAIPLDRNLEAFSGNSYLLMSKHPSDFSVYQAWLGVAKGADTSRGFDWGFNADVLFGTDAKYGQNFGDQTFDYGWGSGDYHTSIIQLYATLGYKDLQFRIGKFATGMTHEALPCVATFFHSYAFNCYNLPLHVSGVMADYSVNKQLSVSGGWNTGQQNSFENPAGDNAFLGKVVYTPSDRFKMTYNLYAGKTHGPEDTATNVSQSVSVAMNLNSKWLYMIETAWVDNRYNDSDANSSYIGINQHLIYTFNDRWAAGLRGEWTRGNGTLFDPTEDGAGGNLYALTLGANWTPNKWLIVRPELRHDWSVYNDGFRPFANGTQANQLSGGGSFIVKF